MRRIKVAMVQEDTGSLEQVKEMNLEGTAAVSFVLKKREKKNAVEANGGVVGEIDRYMLVALARVMADTVKGMADGKAEKESIKAVFINAFLRQWME